MIAPLGAWWALLAGFILLLTLLSVAPEQRSSPWMLIALVLLTGWGFDFAAGGVYGPASLLLYAAASVTPLLLFYLITRAEGIPLDRLGFRLLAGRTAPVLALSAVLVGIYLLIRSEPGFRFGFGTLAAPDTAGFALFFLTAPVIALGQEAVFRGYLLGELAGRSSFRVALFGSALLFAASTLNPVVWAGLPPASMVQLLFQSALTTFVYGIFAGLYYYKANWSLLGPWSVRTGFLWATTLWPFAARVPDWETDFIFSMIALAGLIVVAYLVLREPRYQARHFLEVPSSPRRRTLISGVRSRRQLVGTGIALVAVVVVAGVSGPVLGAASHVPLHFYAIATGSMVPTYPPGTLVVTEPVAAVGDLHAGDVIAYNGPYLSPNGPVVHRILHIGLNGSVMQITTMGDHNPRPDPRRVLFCQVEGKVVGAVPYVGYFVLSPALTIGVLAMVFLVAIYRIAPTEGGPARRRPVIPLGATRR